MGGILAFFKGGLSTWQLYVIVFLVGVMGVLWMQNHSRGNTIEKQLKEIATLEAGRFLLSTANEQLNLAIVEQNSRIDALKLAGDLLQETADFQEQIIADLLENDTVRINGVDSEIIPVDCAGAILWMRNKAVEDLK